MQCEQECLLGRIDPHHHTRICMRCRSTLPADGTFTAHRVADNLEWYDRGLFSQWTYGWIRTFLRLEPDDLLLTLPQDHTRLYVFRIRPV